MLDGLPVEGSAEECATPLEPPSVPRAPLLIFWLSATLLFAIACLRNEVWLMVWNSWPGPLRDHLQPIAFAWRHFAAAKASVFLFALFGLAGPWVPTILRTLRQGLGREDLRQALLAMIGLLALSTVAEVSSLGSDYKILSLAPFDQASNELHRRILEISLAYFAHLNGSLFILFHFCLVLFLLMLLRLAFKSRGITLSFLELVSIGTSAFVFHNFQYPGYPDVLIVVLALLLIVVDLPSYGRAALAALALLTHEALAIGVLVPLFLMFPWRDRMLLLALTGLYCLFWAADFGFDAVAGLHTQINYQGHSGPKLLLARPLVVALGVAVAFKLLWLPMIAYLTDAGREEIVPLLRRSAPLAAALGLCVLSYDTSRMAGMAFVTLLAALPPLWERLGARARTVLFGINLILPSPYVSPSADTPFGMIWYPGLYSAYCNFNTDYLVYHGFPTDVHFLPSAQER